LVVNDIRVTAAAVAWGLLQQHGSDAAIASAGLSSETGQMSKHAVDTWTPGHVQFTPHAHRLQKHIGNANDTAASSTKPTQTPSNAHHQPVTALITACSPAA
jgi:hypothetical protein